jgi:co-chaperonin GroES (HSP10)
MNIEPTTIEPLGGRVLVKLDPKPTHYLDGIELPTVAVSKQTCRQCQGEGGFGVPIYEEDNQRINRWEDVECHRCNGKGYLEATYDPRERDLHTAVVLAVGKGDWRVGELEPATYQPVYWKDLREPMPMKEGDRVVLAGWAGHCGYSFFLSEDLLIVNQYEVLVNLGPAAKVQAPIVMLPLPVSKAQDTLPTLSPM